MKRRLGWRKGPTHPCVGCGYCCKKTICYVGLRLYGLNLDHCPGLIWSEEDQRHYCKPAMYSKKIKHELSIGAGCCSSLNTWRKPPIKRR